MDDSTVDLEALRAEATRHRDLRRALEASIDAVATSLDGRRFSFRAPVGLFVQTGGYVALETASGTVLGQVTDRTLALRAGPELSHALPGATGGVTSRVRVQLAEGEGILLHGRAPFHDVPLRPAAPEEVADALDGSGSGRARLRLGALLDVPGVPATLDAGGFDRHTFLCGQSGSGKSYCLGVLVEQLLLETTLRIVVLDPNSDMVRLREVRPDADPREAARWSGEVAPGIVVRRAGPGDDALTLRFFDLDASLTAAAAGLDPVADREEYATIREALAAHADGLPPDELVGRLTTGGAAQRALGMRLANLGLLDWDLWTRGRGGRTLTEDLDATDARCLVVDLGSVPRPRERALAAAAALDHLWRRRHERRPVLVVIDEAHNVCPQQPEDPVTALATRSAVRIAAEGRKFGIHLLVATQRPQKVHENVVSQADNLVLMRMNSAGDVARLSELFSFAPPGLVERSRSLLLGESLVAGRIAPTPMFVRVGGRVAAEGGGDVPATWAAPAPGG